MSLLPETQDALLEFGASQEYMFGLHEANEPRAGMQGRNIAEVPFDPVRHSPLAINPFSVWEQVLGVPHVKVNIPGRPLNANVVIHQPASEGLDHTYRYGEHRRWLARKLGTAIIDSMPGITDRTWVYSIGEAADEVTDPDTEVITTNGDPQEESDRIAEICKSGLTFVVSGFLRLPLHEQDKATFPSTVGVKANVLTDRGIVPSGLVVRSGVKAGEVNTANSDDVQENSELLEQQHTRVVKRLKGTGIAVASVVLARKVAYGFEAAVADAAIARAVRQVTPK